MKMPISISEINRILLVFGRHKHYQRSAQRCEGKCGRPKIFKITDPADLCLSAQTIGEISTPVTSAKAASAGDVGVRIKAWRHVCLRRFKAYSVNWFNRMQQ